MLASGVIKVCDHEAKDVDSRAQLADIECNTLVAELHEAQPPLAKPSASPRLLAQGPLCKLLHHVGPRQT